MESPVAVSPSNRFRQLTKDIDSLTTFVGVGIMAPRLQLDYRTWITLFVIVTYATFSIFSICNNAGDWTESLKASSMIGGLFHGLGKFLTCVLKQQAMRSLTLYSTSIYEEYEKLGTPYRTALHTNIDRLLGFITVIRNGYMVTISMMNLLPLAMLVYDGSRVTTMQYEIPGLPLKSNLGYTVTYVIQFISMLFGGVGFFAGDLFVVLGLAQIITFADLMQLKIKELNEALDHKAESRALLAVGSQIGGDKEQLHLLLEVIKWHQLFTDYCRSVNGIYHELIASQVISMALSMMVTFCINLTGFNLTLSIFFVISAYSMSIYCFLGTILDFAFDQVYVSICNVAWYELSVGQRKLFGLMLREAQHPPTLLLLGVIPLSVQTALEIAKLIYSASMMVMNRT